MAAELAGQKWTAAVLLSLARGAGRFTEVRHTVSGISDRMLSARLRDLERQGLVVRQVTPSVPVQIRYELSESGWQLIRALAPLVDWGQRWMQDDPAADAR